MHFLVVNQHLGWQAFQYPDMLQSFIRRHALAWVQDQAFLHEVCKVRVIAAQHEFKGLPVGLSVFSP